jgi:transcriptional regulator with XRE-family HTH domain
MNTLSMTRLASTVIRARKEQNLTQQDVQEMTGINRLLIGRIEKGDFLPSLPQLNLLAEKLNFNIADLIEDASEQNVFFSMRGEAKNAEEEEGIEKLFSMMGFLKSQMLLRSKLG